MTLQVKAERISSEFLSRMSVMKSLYYNVISRNALPKHKHLANSGRVQHRPKGLSDDQHKPKCQKTTVWVSGKLIYKVS